MNNAAAGNAASPPPPVPSKRRGLKFLIVVLVLLIVGGLSAVWFYGAHQAHQKNAHPLDPSFDDSPDHKKLLGQLQKSKLSVLSGKKENGLIHFVRHYANKLSQSGKTVFLEDVDNDLFEYYQLAKDAKGTIDGILGGGATGDWILVSQKGAVPEELINKVKERNPDAKILVANTAGQKVNGFKAFSFPQVDEKVLEKIITKSLKVKPHVADILFDYFGSVEKTFENVVGEFNHTQFLGDSHKSLDGLTKEDKTLLQTLCSKGNAKSKKASQKLLELGLIFLEGSYYWQTLQSILNYELGVGINCKTALATEEVIKAFQSNLEKQAEERKAREEAERKKEEERKAEEERKQQEAKAKEEQQRLENEKKKEQAEAAKAAKAAKAEAKQEKGSKKAEKAPKAPKAAEPTAVKPPKVKK